MNADEILKTEYSNRFDEIRKNAMIAGYYKYGPVSKDYSTGNMNAMKTMELCIQKYKDTGNTEYLADAANYCMLEFMYPQHPKAHYRATESHESAGYVGLSSKDAEEIKRQADAESGKYY